MTKDKKKIAISICVCISAVAVLAVVYVLIKRKGKKESVAADAATADSHLIAVAPSISPGSRGSAVRQLQRLLNDKLVSNYLVRSDYPVDKNGARIVQLDVDGIFGEKTEAVCLWWYGKTTITMEDL